MRKLMCVMLSCMLLLGLTACGGEEEVKNAAVGTFEQNGITITMSFDAKGDKVTRLTQKSVIPTEGYTEEQLQALREVVDQAAATYDDFESVEYTSEEEEGQMVETIVIPTDEETLKQVVEAGLLPVDDENVTELSLEQTKKNLEDTGWTFEE